MAEELQIKISADVAQATKGIETVSTSLQNIKRPAADATNAIGNLSRVVQDAPYGFIGVANNINPLLESFQRLKKESGSTKGALQAMATGLTGAGGLGLAVGVASSLLVVFGDRIFGAGKKTTEAAKEFKSASDAIAAASSEFSKAVNDVSSLRQELQLAKDGFISKTGVIEHYNETIGKTTGLVKTLDEAETALAKNADAYIRFTLLKAAAQSAQRKAAEELLKAEEEGFNRINIAVRNGTEQQMANDRMLANSLKGLNQKVNQSVNAAKASSERFSDIAKRFRQEAAEIARAFNFNYFSDNKEVKLPKEKIKKEMKALELTLPPLRFDVLPYIRQDFVGGNIVGKLPQQAWLTEMLKKIKEAEEATAQRALGIATTISDTVTPAFQGMFDAIFEGQNVVKGFFNGLAQGLKSLLQKMAAALVQALALKAIFSALFPGSSIAKSSVGKLFSGIMGFAAGGLAFGPTLGLVGEGKGTNRSNPEVIAPLDKLKDFIGGAGGYQLSVSELRLSGKDLIAAIAVNQRSQGRTF